MPFHSIAEANHVNQLARVSMSTNGPKKMQKHLSYAGKSKDGWFRKDAIQETTLTALRHGTEEW